MDEKTSKAKPEDKIVVEGLRQFEALGSLSVEQIKSILRELKLVALKPGQTTLERIAELEAENAELKRWVDDLQSGMFVNCVYCGHRYGPKEDVPASMADILKEHVERCPEHPMSALRADAEMLRWIQDNPEQAANIIVGASFEDKSSFVYNYPESKGGTSPLKGGLRMAIAEAMIRQQKQKGEEPEGE